MFCLSPTILMSLDKHLPLFEPSHTDTVHIYIVIGWIVMVQLRTLKNLYEDDYNTKPYLLTAEFLSNWERSLKE